MEKIDIYFVRHGETGGNVAKRHQQEDTHLTKRGKEQARAVAKVIVDLKPTHFYVSQRVRTLETGQAIGEALDMVPESDPLFVELKRPDDLYGYHHRSVKTASYLWGWWRGKIGGCGEEGEGESCTAFLERIEKAKRKLADHPTGSKVVVVSHAVFISMFVTHMNHPKPLSLLSAIYTFYKIKTLKNASVTHLEYDKENQVWSIK